LSGVPGKRAANTARWNTHSTIVALLTPPVAGGSGHYQLARLPADGFSHPGARGTGHPRDLHSRLGSCSRSLPLVAGPGNAGGGAGRIIFSDTCLQNTNDPAHAQRDSIAHLEPDRGAILSAEHSDVAGVLGLPGRHDSSDAGRGANGILRTHS